MIMKETRSGIVELECSGKWPVNPSPKTGEIPRLFYWYDAETLLCVFSDGILEMKNIHFDDSDPTLLSIMWNHETIVQKWSDQAVKATKLDINPSCAIDNCTGTIFGGYSSVEEGMKILESGGFFKLETDFRFYIMRDGYFVPVEK